MAAHNEPNLFDVYFDYVKDTETPMVFHRWSLIAAVSALLGRKFWMPFGSIGRIYPNCYIMLIGNPGSRKSTAIKKVKKELSRVGYDHFSADKTTKEKFLLDLEGKPENEHGTERNGFGRGTGNSAKREAISPSDVLAALDLGSDEGSHDGIPREMFICADEFNEFAGSGNLDFFSLLGALWDWDDDAACYKYRLKNSRSVSIYQPTISLLGGNTHSGLQEAFPVESIGQGFMSRLLLIYSEPSGRRIAFPKEPPAELRERVTASFGKIAETVSGEATLTRQAQSALEMIYASWRELEDYRFKFYSTRRFTHLLKLVLICAACRYSSTIDIQDVLLANTILTYAESQMPKALGEFGRSKNSDAAQAVMSKLYETTKPLSHQDLWEVVSRDLDKREQLSEILQGLQQAKKIQFVKEAGGFLPVQKPINTAVVYVDFNLLREISGKVR